MLSEIIQSERWSARVLGIRRHATTSSVAGPITGTKAKLALGTNVLSNRHLRLSNHPCQQTLNWANLSRRPGLGQGTIQRGGAFLPRALTTGSAALSARVTVARSTVPVVSQAVYLIVIDSMTQRNRGIFRPSVPSPQTTTQ